MTVQMHINPESFSNILRGTKFIEHRLYDAKRKSLRVSDIIIFTNRKNNKDKVRTKVVALYRFKSFQELYDKLPHSHLGYVKDNIGDPADMLKYYDEKKLSNHEVIGIKFQVVDRLTENAIYDIEDKIGYTFKNKDTLTQAFTKRNLAKKNGSKDSELLEFLGDSVLGFIVTKMLFEYMISDKEQSDNQVYTEGDLTELRSLLVENKNLETTMNQFNLAKYLLTPDHYTVRGSDKSDLLESIIGAVALDSTYNIPLLYSLVEKFINPRIYLSSFYLQDYFELKRWFKLRKITKPGIKTKVLEDNKKTEYETNLKFSKYLIKEVADTKIDSLFRASGAALRAIRANNEEITAKDFLRGLTAHNGRDYLDKLKKYGFYTTLLVEEKKMKKGSVKVTYTLPSFSTWYIDRDKRKAHKICALVTLNEIARSYLRDNPDIKALILELDKQYFD